MNFENLDRLQKEIQKVCDLSKSNFKHENGVIFYGYSFSGKSSMINYIIDNDLIGKKIEDGTISIESVNKLSGPEITFDPKANKIPTRWENSKKLPGLALWNINIPEFGNHHAIQDIMRAYYIHNIFKSIQSVKIILVIDLNDVTFNRIKSVVNLLQSVENWFKDKMHEFFDCIAVIFTKVPDKILDNSANKDFIIRLLHQELLSSIDIKISNTIMGFVEYLIHNQENIGLFKQAKLGPITDEIEVDIIKCIKNVNSIKQQTLKYVKPAIEEESYAFLRQAQEELFSINELNGLLKTIRDIFYDDERELLKFNKNNKCIGNLLPIKNKLIAQLDQLKRIIDFNYTFYERIDLLRNISPVIERKFVINELVEMLKFMEFTDDLLNHKEVELFNIELLCILSKVMSKFDKILVNIIFQMGEIDEKEVEERVKKTDLLHKQKIYIFKKELVDIKKYKVRKSLMKLLQSDSDSVNNAYVIVMSIILIMIFLHYELKMFVR